MRSVSSTQVSGFEDCKRRWVFDYVMGLRVTSPEKRDGNAIHKLPEDYVKKGEMPSGEHLEGRIARALIDILPPRHSGLQAEVYFQLATFPGGPPWRGKIDVLDVSVPMVTDWKTLKSAFFYAKLAPELLTDAQMVAYAAHASLVRPDAEKIYVRHVYALRKKGQSRVIPVLPVVACFDRPRLLSEWSAKVEVVREMVALEAARPDPQDVQPNPLACGKYGGCPHLSRCGLSSEQRMMGTMSQTLEDLRRQQLAAQGIMPPESQAAFAQQQPRQPWELEGHFVPGGYAPGPKDPSGQWTMTNSEGRVFFMPREADRPAPPPPAPPPPAAPAAPPPPPPQAWQPPPPTVVTAPAPAPAATLPSGTFVPPQVYSPAAAPAPATFVPPPPATQSAQVQTPAPAPANGAPTAAAAAAPKSHKKKKAADAAAGEELEIWVDVLPVKGFPEGASALEDWMRPVVDIAAQLAGQDWRALPYATGKAYLFAACKKHAEAAGVPSGVVVARTSTMGVDVVLEFLIPHAARVLQGAPGR